MYQLLVNNNIVDLTKRDPMQKVGEKSLYPIINSKTFKIQKLMTKSILLLGYFSLDTMDLR